MSTPHTTSSQSAPTGSTLSERDSKALLADFGGIEEAPLPDDLCGQLRGYQKHGVDWLCFLRGAGLGALLADDMGLGKTLQTLCALQGRSLIIMPTSLLHSWADEIDRFRPGLSYSVYHGAGRKLDVGVDVVLTSYAIEVTVFPYAAFGHVEYAIGISTSFHCSSSSVQARKNHRERLPLQVAT